LAGDPLWQPNLNDPLEQAVYAGQTLGNDKLKQAVQAFQQQQKEEYNRGRLNEAASSPAVVELLARAAAGNQNLQQQLQANGLSVTGGNTPTIVDQQGNPIDPQLARQIFVATNQTVPEFANAGKEVKQVGAVPPYIRRPMSAGPNPQDESILRAWDSGDPAIRAKILADPQTRAVIAQWKSTGANP